MSDACRWALGVAIRDKALKQHMLAEIDRPRAVPSASTLSKHRPTVHMLDGGVVLHGTIDSSPQGPYDFVMHGARQLTLDAVVQCFRS